jgi:hypothetical protein
MIERPGEMPGLLFLKAIALRGISGAMIRSKWLINVHA